MKQSNPTIDFNPKGRKFWYDKLTGKSSYANPMLPKFSPTMEIVKRKAPSSIESLPPEFPSSISTGLFATWGTAFSSAGAASAQCSCITANSCSFPLIIDPTQQGKAQPTSFAHSSPRQ